MSQAMSGDWSRYGWFWCAPLLFFVLVAPLLLKAEQPLPTLKGPVTDAAGLLTAEVEQQIAESLLAFEKEKGSQVVVVAVSTTLPESIEQFSMRLAESWKIGRRAIDDGVILLIAVKDRAVRIEVGYGLEGALPDAIAKRIIDSHILPYFKEGDFAGGIESGLAAIFARIRQEPLPPPARLRSSGQSEFDQVIDLGFFAFITALAFASFLKVAGSGAMALLVTSTLGLILSFLLLSALSAKIVASLAAIAGSLIGAFGEGRVGRGGFGGGGFSSRGGGSGGFSGGGGSFGGGGASGRW